MTAAPTTLTLAEFLERRLAEDEAAARAKGADAMTGWRWKHAPESVYQELQAEVLANSRRVLAQVAALRKVVELHRPEVSDWKEVICTACGTGYEGSIGPEPGAWHEAVPWPCPTLRALAAVWADHDEWREEWR